MAHFTLPAHVITGEHILKEAVPYFKEMGTTGTDRNRQTCSEIRNDGGTEDSP